VVDQIANHSLARNGLQPHKGAELKLPFVLFCPLVEVVGEVAIESVIQPPRELIWKRCSLDRYFAVAIRWIITTAIAVNVGDDGWWIEWIDGREYEAIFNELAGDFEGGGHWS
jgi:hypothetical protein